MQIPTTLLLLTGFLSLANSAAIPQAASTAKNPNIAARDLTLAPRSDPSVTYSAHNTWRPYSPTCPYLWLASQPKEYDPCKMHKKAGDEEAIEAHNAEVARVRDQLHSMHKPSEWVIISSECPYLWPDDNEWGRQPCSTNPDPVVKERYMRHKKLLEEEIYEE